jgi:hypothetical protein
MGSSSGRWIAASLESVRGPARITCFGRPAWRAAKNPPSRWTTLRDVALDPIVSLSVALAEAPGSVALFLGSGVSVDAGIPTGWDIYVDGVQRLRRLEEGDVEPLPADAVANWLADTGRGDFNYSRLLEDIVPDPATRRTYIAGYFADASPGATHEHVADLVARAFVRVVVTTNFDRMLEQALAARGIDPVVVSDDASLAAMPRREHVDCFLLKAHGDYQQETIRNTPGELAQLEPGVAAELQAILDRYGVVLVGYSGSDEAIRRALRARTSRYGLWWLSRSDPPRSPTPELLERTAGRSIIRRSASEFFADLNGRLAVYQQHPSGHTPATVHDEILALLRTGDQVGLTEALRREHHAYDSGLTAWTAAHANDGNDLAAVEAALPELISQLQRRLAAVLPVALHDPVGLAETLRALARTVETRQLHDHWHDHARWAGWAIGYTVGAILTRLERWPGAFSIATITVNDGHSTEFLLRHSGTLGQAIAQVHSANRGKNFYAGDWEHLHEIVGAFTWLTDRYPELTDGEGEPRGHLSAFDFVANFAAALRQERHLAYWTMGGQAARETARRMNAEPNTLKALAELAAEPDVTADRLAELIAERLPAHSHFLGQFPDWRGAVSVLLTGTAQD